MNAKEALVEIKKLLFTENVDTQEDKLDAIDCLICLLNL